MDGSMIIGVIGGLVLAFAAALAVGLWLFDVQPAPLNSDPPQNNGDSRTDQADD
jgi:hypothetical protein